MNFKVLAYVLIIICLPINMAYSKSTNNKPTTIERYAWVGGNRDGTIVAYLISSFRPSSQAPFVKLTIKQADQPKPLFVDTAGKLYGDEQDLTELASYLVEKNTGKLNEHGIQVSKDLFYEASAIIFHNEQSNISSSWVEVPNVGLSNITIKIKKNKNPCDYDRNSHNYNLVYSLDKIKKLSVSSEICGSGRFIVRNAYRTETTLWFIVYQQSSSMGMDLWWLDIQGIKFGTPLLHLLVSG